MAAPIPREWTGLQQFPAATQTSLHELLGKLKEEVTARVSLALHLGHLINRPWLGSDCTCVASFDELMATVCFACVVMFRM
jgi:hypothetical protein